LPHVARDAVVAQVAPSTPSAPISLAPGMVVPLSLAWSEVLRVRGLDPRRAIRDGTLLLHVDSALS
jgi:hypothetical protein